MRKWTGLQAARLQATFAKFALVAVRPFRAWTHASRDACAPVIEEYLCEIS